jgi:SagB-type dehydrogenase family enzyme
MEATVLLSLIDGATLEDAVAGTLVVRTPREAHRVPLTLTPVGPPLAEALRDLQGEGVSQGALGARVMQSAGFAGFGLIQRFLAALDRAAVLRRSLSVDGQRVASIDPASAFYRWSDDLVDPERSYRLSRFACCRRDEQGLVLECPLGHARVGLHAPAALLAVGTLAEPRTAGDLGARVQGLGEEGARLLMSFLANGAALVPCDEGKAGPEEGEAKLALWEFHDLLFHSRSRLGRHSNAYGGAYPFKDRFDELPAIRPARGEPIPLPKPDLARLAVEDRPFTAVLEARRSKREYGERPITRDQLAEFLYRAARVQKAALEAGVSFRPHPAGGALHELEIYPVVSRCEGLAAGLYHYDAFGHRLERIAQPSPPVEALLQMAAITATIDAPPQVLLVITARFQRIQWKYRSMCYALILKNVGALYQTMYLVATAMGLAPTALGGGHSDVFAAAAGLDYLAETSVGEFVLGSGRG